MVLSESPMNGAVTQDYLKPNVENSQYVSK